MHALTARLSGKVSHGNKTVVGSHKIKYFKTPNRVFTSFAVLAIVFFRTSAFVVSRNILASSTVKARAVQALIYV